MHRLAFDDVARLLREGPVGITLQYVEGVLDWGQGSAQLVGEHREELILASAGLGDPRFAQAQGLLDALPLRQLALEIRKLLRPAAPPPT